MKFKIIPDKVMSRAVYNMASGANREFLEDVVGLMTSISKQLALEVCTDVVDGGDKSFDRGFVKGINEAAEMLVRAYLKGDAMFHGGTTTKDKVVHKF